MGEGMGQGRRRVRPEEAFAPGGPQALLAEEVGGGEDLFLAGAEPQEELRDYEKLAETSEALIYVAMKRLMARRLARA